MNTTLTAVVFVAVLGLFGVGLYALLISRHLIKVIVGLQVLVKGAMLGLVLAGRTSGQIETGQALALTVIVADTIVAVVGLALAVQIQRHFHTLDITKLTTLRR